MPADSLHQLSILLVEDNPGDARLVEELLREAPEYGEWAPESPLPQLDKVRTVNEARNRLRDSDYDIILLDLGLPDSQGLDTLRTVRLLVDDCPIVVLTVESEHAVGLSAVREGAQDYLVKNRMDQWSLPRAVHYAIERCEQQKQTLKAQLEIRATKDRAESAEQTNRQLEREVEERKRAENRVRELNLTLTERLDRLAAVHAIDRVINASMNLQMTLDVVMRQLRRQLNVDATAVLLYREDGMQLEYTAGEGFRGDTITRRTVRLGEGPVGEAALRRQQISQGNLDTAQDLLPAELLSEDDFHSYHALPLVAKGHLRGWLEVYHREPFNAGREWFGFLETLAEQTAIAIDNASLLQGLQRSNSELALAYDRTIEGWSRALDLRDEETEGHSRRVTELTVELARAMGIREEQLAHVRRGALLHDIGKMGIPDAILLKPDSLTSEEWEIMKLHPIHALELLAPIAFLRPALDIPYCHHEKWDGSGYPRGLKGTQISLAARIFAVIDVFDALTSNRPYRAAWSKQEALRHIRQQSGSHFDPEIVEVFLQLHADGA